MTNSGGSLKYMLASMACQGKPFLVPLCLGWGRIHLPTVVACHVPGARLIWSNRGDTPRPEIRLWMTILLGQAHGTVHSSPRAHSTSAGEPQRDTAGTLLPDLLDPEGNHWYHLLVGSNIVPEQRKPQSGLLTFATTMPLTWLMWDGTTVNPNMGLEPGQ